jgi:PKD repeat protein
VAFDTGIRHTFPNLRTSQGGFVNTDALVLSSGDRHTFPNLRTSQGGFVNADALVLSPGKRQTFPDLRTSSVLVLQGVVIFSASHHLYMSIMVPSVIDDTRRLALGVAVDFIGFPRIGRRPLPVQFEQRCKGIIREFYWEFGDGGYRFFSDPANIYKRVGVYDVLLRIRVGNRYYSCKKLEYIRVLAGDLIVSITDNALRCAITKDQGIGMYRIPVDKMPMPEARVGVLSILDSDGISRGLVLDSATGLWYDVTTRQVNGELVEWRGIDTTGLGDNDLTRSITFGQDRSKREKEKLRFLEAHIGIVPVKEENRDEAGYDANGFPSGMEADLEAFIDGEPDTAAAKIRAIPFDGELKIRGDLRLDRKVEAHGIQWKITTNRGAHSITGRQMSYVLSKKSSPPPLRLTSESEYQAELSEVVLWPWYIGGTLINRRTGTAITGATAAAGSAGLDERLASALKFSSVINLGSGSSSPISLIFWSTKPVTVMVGSTVVSTTEHGSYIYGMKTWSLYYSAAISASGAVTITPSEETELFDFRAFASLLSDEARTYYYDDVSGNGGKVVFPR